MVYRLPRAQPFWPITPLGASTENPKNTLEHLAIITPGTLHALECR
jgi:hypothetical protein